MTGLLLDAHFHLFHQRAKLADEESTDAIHQVCARLGNLRGSSDA